jgi:hypothetical protein
MWRLRLKVVDRALKVFLNVFKYEVLIGLSPIEFKKENSMIGMISDVIPKF